VAFRRQVALARHQQHRISRQQPDEGECRDRHPDEGRDEQQQPVQEETQHEAITGLRHVDGREAHGANGTAALMRVRHEGLRR
jgi:hypothetical protein